MERDEAAIRQCKREQWPELKKSPKTGPDPFVDSTQKQILRFALNDKSKEFFSNLLELQSLMRMSQVFGYAFAALPLAVREAYGFLAA